MPITVESKTETITCPSCSQLYTLQDPPELGTFLAGTLCGFIFGFFIFTATGKAIMEALGYRVLEKIKPKE